MKYYIAVTALKAYFINSFKIFLYKLFTLTNIYTHNVSIISHHSSGFVADEKSDNKK